MLKFITITGSSSAFP